MTLVAHGSAEPLPTPGDTYPEHASQDQLLLKVVEAARRLGVGRSLMYELINSGEIDSIHVGRLRRIPPDALTDYIARRRDSFRPET